MMAIRPTPVPSARSVKYSPNTNSFRASVAWIPRRKRFVSMNTGAVIASASANWPTATVVPSLASTEIMPH